MTPSATPAPAPPPAQPPTPARAPSRRAATLRAAVPVLRAVAVAEGIVFPVLLVLAVVDAAHPLPTLIMIVGSLHAALWCAYILLVVVLRRTLGWNLRTTAVALVASLVPAGTWWIERRWIVGTPSSV